MKKKKKQKKKTKKNVHIAQTTVSPSFGPVSWAPTIFPSHFKYNSYITMYCLVSIEKEQKKKKNLPIGPVFTIANCYRAVFRCKTYISIYYLVSIEKE